jgi:EAL domain-containing protein (putative c-di-GMP-specific phosphodiesterase class I)
MLAWAELAASEAKRQGRGRAVAMTEQLLQLQQRRLRLLARLASATSDHSLTIAYQSIVAADNQRIVAMEALLRWQCAGLGPVSPAEFIPLAESADLVSGLGQWVLQHACTAAAQWRATGGGVPPKLAVNTSIKQLAAPQYMDHVLRVLASSGLAPTRLVVEVTESVFDEGNMAQILSNLLALHNLGAEIHVDDFGTGYSSLSRLQELPLHAVKIDKSFVQSHGMQSRAVIEAAVLIAHRFGLRTIAEGVETEAQAAMLAQLGVDELQGYWFGKPDPRVPACFSALPCRLALAAPA